eukprot:jgi/Psemu1/35201/gm1.35201_g
MEPKRQSSPASFRALQTYFEVYYGALWNTSEELASSTSYISNITDDDDEAIETIAEERTNSKNKNAYRNSVGSRISIGRIDRADYQRRKIPKKRNPCSNDGILQERKDENKEQTAGSVSTDSIGPIIKKTNAYRNSVGSRIGSQRKKKKKKCEERRRPSKEKQHLPTSGPHQEQETTENIRTTGHSDNNVDRSENTRKTYQDPVGSRIGHPEDTVEQRGNTSALFQLQPASGGADTAIPLQPEFEQAERHAARNAERARRLQQAVRNQEIEIEFGEAENADTDDDTNSEDTSSDDTSSEENKDEEDSDEDSSSSSESNWSDDASSNNSKMSYSKVPKLPCDDEVDFAGWYRKFLTHASSRKYLTMVSAKAHTDLPPEGELTEYSDMNKAQKNAIKAHSKALNDLHIGFEDNPAGEAIIEKSKIDREESWEDNAKITLQWPRGRVHHIFEELFKRYRKTTPADRLQLEEDLRDIKMSMTANPKGVFQELFRVVQKYQYKTIKPTPDDLYATILCALPKYLVMHLSKDLSMLWQEDAPPFAIIEKMETIVEDLYNNMLVKGITTASSHKDMVLFGAEVIDFAKPDTRDKKANGNNESNNNSNNNESNNNSNNNESNSNSNGGQHGRPKCSICGGKHRDVMCWEDDRNVHQRPPNWKPKKKSDMQGAEFNTAYRSDGGQLNSVWYDWALFNVGACEIPCHILCFLKLYNLKEPYSFVSEYQIANKGIYAVVTKFKSTPTPTALSFVTRGELDKNSLFLFHVDSILSDVAVVPQLNAMGTLQTNSYLVVSNQRAWLDEFHQTTSSLPNEETLYSQCTIVEQDSFNDIERNDADSEVLSDTSNT